MTSRKIQSGQVRRMVYLLNTCKSARIAVCSAVASTLPAALLLSSAVLLLAWVLPGA